MGGCCRLGRPGQRRRRRNGSLKGSERLREDCLEELASSGRVNGAKPSEVSRKAKAIEGAQKPMRALAPLT
jgi:hypothetical protein